TVIAIGRTFSRNRLSARRAKRPGGRPGRYVRFVIARYTRPELGRIWTDQARMEHWRQVEVAACEAMQGPSPEELEAIRAGAFTDTLCVGRTHGIQAEPTTFGIKLAGFAFEAHRNAERLERAFSQAAVGAISGAVGTYSATAPDFERRVMERLGLRAEDV